MTSSTNYSSHETAQTSASVEIITEHKQEQEDDSEYICQTKLIHIKSVRSKDGIEEAISIEWKPNDNSQQKAIRFSTLLEPECLAPLFSGAEWAGTRLWDAAIECIHYLHDQYFSNHLLAVNTPVSLLELGCGLGVPGMMSSMMGIHHVVLTDQAQILTQLNKNIRANFPMPAATTQRSLDLSQLQTIQAKALPWSRKEVAHRLASMTPCFQYWALHHPHLLA